MLLIWTVDQLWVWYRQIAIYHFIIDIIRFYNWCKNQAKGALISTAIKQKGIIICWKIGSSNSRQRCRRGKSTTKISRSKCYKYQHATKTFNNNSKLISRKLANIWLFWIVDFKRRVVKTSIWRLRWKRGNRRIKIYHSCWNLQTKRLFR